MMELKFVKNRTTESFAVASEVYKSLTGEELPGGDVLSDEFVTIEKLKPVAGKRGFRFSVASKPVAGWKPSSRERIGVEVWQELPISELLPTIKDPTWLSAKVAEKLYQQNDYHTLIYSNSQFYQWNGKFWAVVSDEDVFLAAWREIQNLYLDYNTKHIEDKVKISRSLVLDVVSSLKANRQTYKRPGQWLADKADNSEPEHLMFCQNGRVDIEVYQAGLQNYFTSHCPDFFNTSVFSFDFDPHAAAPTRWLQFLNELWPHDAASHSLLQEILGYLLTKPWLHFYFVLCGATRGGKSTIANLMSEIVGHEHVAALELHRLADRFALQSAVNKWLLLMSESEHWPGAKSGALRILNAISARDALQVDVKGKPPITFAAWGMPVIVGNHPPALEDDSQACINRLILLRFTESFKGKEDTGLLNKLRKEIPGIVNWAIEGWLRLRINEGHFTLPDSSKELIDTIDENASPIRDWAGDCCLIDPSATGGKAELYESYSVYAAQRQLIVPPLNKFCMQLLGAFPKLHPSKITIQGERKRLPVFRGIALREVNTKTNTQRATA